MIYNSTNTTKLPLGAVNMGRGDYVAGLLGGSVYFGATGTASTMVLSGNTITITLGTYQAESILVGRSTAGGTGTMVWTPVATPYDRAANALSTTAGDRVRRRRPGLLMRGRVIPLVTCLVLLGGLAAVALGQVGTPSLARAAAVRAAGSFEISNSADGSPIFAASGIAPGDSVKGEVTIEDPGSVPVALKLQRGELTDAAGIGGGTLSDRLQLTVSDVTGAGSAADHLRRAARLDARTAGRAS